MPIIIFFMMLFFISSWPLHANDTSFGGEGTLPIPRAQTAVKMVNETIILQGHQLDVNTFHGEWRVRCDFTFQNTSDVSKTLIMGFPLPIIDEEDYANVSVPKGYSNKNGSPLVHDFLVSVNNKSVPVHRELIGANPKKGIFYEEAYLWKMVFAPKEVLSIHHDYITGITMDVMGFNTVRYVLQTGRLWQGGSIGHTHVEVIPNTATRLCSEVDKSATYYPTRPSGMKIIGKGKERHYVWDLKNFHPRSDLLLCLQTGRDYIHQQIVLAIINKTFTIKSLPEMTWRKLRNTIYAQYGRRFDSPDLQAYFDAQWWYVPNAHYSDALLSVEDKQALAWIKQQHS